MNKFIAFTLFALVASVSCGPVPEDQEVETELLLGKEKLFSSFCQTQGKLVREDIVTMTRESTSQVFRMFFEKINEITDDVLNVQKEAVKQLTATLNNPSSEDVDEESTISEDQIAEMIKEGKEAIKEKNAVAGLVPATKSAVQAMLGAANSALFTRLAKARSVINGALMFSGVKSACELVSDYETRMEEALKAVKADILAKNDDAEVQKFVESQSLINLNCLTTKNIVRVHAFCDIVMSGHVHFFKMLGMNSPLSKFQE